MSSRAEAAAEPEAAAGAGTVAKSKAKADLGRAKGRLVMSIGIFIAGYGCHGVHL